MCYLDLQSSSASDTGGYAVTGEDTDICSDSDSDGESDEEDDTGGHSHVDNA
jgi:hypothetical protein